MTRTATIMERVESIKADIEALPAIYRPLVQKDLTWLQSHPVVAAIGALIAGAVIGHFV